MKLNEVDLIKFLPKFMRDDKNTNAFVYAIQKELNKITSNIVYARIYSRIDELSEEFLDELAWQFNVVEYNSSYDIEVKRNIIKNCMIIHHQRGTVGAVEKAAQNIFGIATIEEWFEYDGKPYHFKVYTSNPSSNDKMLKDLERVVKETQNVRSYLEEIVVELMQSMNLYVGCRIIIMDDVSLKTVSTI